jgi:hypothetical protein
VEEEMSKAESEIATAIRLAAKWLGTGDAASTMGAIEWLGDCIKDAATILTNPVDEIVETGNRIAGGLEDIAEAIRYVGDQIRKNGS